VKELSLFKIAKDFDIVTFLVCRDFCHCGFCGISNFCTFVCSKLMLVANGKKPVSFDNNALILAKSLKHIAYAIQGYAHSLISCGVPG